MSAPAIPSTPSPLQRKARRLSVERRKQRSYWIFLIPFLAGFALLFFWIYADSLRFSFSTFTVIPRQGFKTEWAGLANYKYALTEDTTYTGNVFATVSGMVGSILMVVLYSLFVAVILSQKMKGRTVFRAIFFIPVILATGFMAKAEMTNLINTGIWNELGEGSGASGTMAGGLIDSWDLRVIMMQLTFSPTLSAYVVDAVAGIFNIVNISGVQMLIFLAGLQSISPSIYESADIDGATAWETFWLVTFPLISPIILVNVVYTVIDSCTRPENPIMVQIEQIGLMPKQMGYASAMAWFYFVVVAVCVIIIMAVIRAMIYYQQRD